MSKLLSVLIAAIFAAVSFTAAAEEVIVAADAVMAPAISAVSAIPAAKAEVKTGKGDSGKKYIMAPKAEAAVGKADAAAK